MIPASPATALLAALPGLNAAVPLPVEVFRDADTYRQRLKPEIAPGLGIVEVRFLREAGDALVREYARAAE